MIGFFPVLLLIPANWPCGYSNAMPPASMMSSLCFRSMPAQNAFLPAPVKTAQRSSGSASYHFQRAPSSIVASTGRQFYHCGNVVSDMELKDLGRANTMNSGRFIVTRRMCFAGKDMRECSIYGCGSSIHSGMGSFVRVVDIVGRAETERCKSDRKGRQGQRYEAEPLIEIEAQMPTSTIVQQIRGTRHATRNLQSSLSELASFLSDISAPRYCNAESFPC